MPPLPSEKSGKQAASNATKAAKVQHVKKAGQTREPSAPTSRDHHCHWPGCGTQVPPALWGCRRHWMMLPKFLRDKVWAAYRPGQEVEGTPSREYLVVAREVQAWIKQNNLMTDEEKSRHLGRRTVDAVVMTHEREEEEPLLKREEVDSSSLQEGDADDPKERLAINIADVTRLPEAVTVDMDIGNLVDLSNPIWVDRNKGDEVAAAFKCGLYRAALFCDVVRSRDRKAGDYPTRIYLLKKTWQRLSGNAVLTRTVKVKGKDGIERDVVLLDRDIFTVEIKPVEGTPLPRQRMF